MDAAIPETKEPRVSSGGGSVGSRASASKAIAIMPSELALASPGKTPKLSPCLSLSTKRCVLNQSSSHHSYTLGYPPHSRVSRSEDTSMPLHAKNSEKRISIYNAF